MIRVHSLGLAFSMILATAELARAFGSSPPPPGRAGVPADGGDTCQGCHDEFDLNAGDVALSLELAGGGPLSTYEPGLVHELVLRLSSGEAGRMRWGFEATPVLSIDDSMAGALAPGADTAVLAGGTRDHVAHQRAKSDPSGASFSFQWTAPDTNLGDVLFHACANAADGDRGRDGDYIECLSFLISPATATDADGDGLIDDDELLLGTDPFDVDSDDDGLWDGEELASDSDGDGLDDPLDCDADADGLVDGLEAGLSLADVVEDPDGAGPLLGTDLTASCGTTGTLSFVADGDPSSTTDPTRADTDGDGCDDGEEDANRNGIADDGSDPNLPGDCAAGATSIVQVLHWPAGPIPAAQVAFATTPCTSRGPDLKICAEAEGLHESFPDATLPLSLPTADPGSVFAWIVFDSDLGSEGTPDVIQVVKDPSAPGGLRIEPR